MKEIIDKLVRSWYDKPRWWTYALLPLTVLFACIVSLRRFLFRHGILKSVKCKVPVIVVGNLTVGGVGKTPLVIYLVKFLRQQGYRPGVVSRGHGGDNKYCREVTDSCDPKLVGDEPLLIVKKTGCPMMIGRDRPAVVQALLAEHACDIIISDDGLQHYPLQRDIEIAVIDAERRFGNRLCLPAGPLREPLARLAECDFIVNNGGAAPGEYEMNLLPGKLHNIHDAQKIRATEAWRGKSVHAVAAIGNPSRFFNTLEKFGLNVLPHVFADHHPFTVRDVTFPDALPVVMTEKDAVKCTRFQDEKLWYLPIEAKLPDSFNSALLILIEKKRAT